MVCHFFTALMGFALLSIQPPPDTVHTRLFLTVVLNFRYTPCRGRPMLCTLQVLAPSGVGAVQRTRGFPSHLGEKNVFVDLREPARKFLPAYLRPRAR
jgi:hypothetical protein